MKLNFGFAPVGSAQKVGKNQKEIDPRRAFNVAWNKTAATVAEVVGISAIANIPVGNRALLTVKILFNDHPYAAAENVEIKGDGSITAQWKVTPYKMGTFTSGQYDVEISYGGGGFCGKTTTPLKIVAAGGDRNASYFG
jgi:hypothetical protein